MTIIDEAPKMIISLSGRKEMIATKDKDVFMTCVVHNKPADKKVHVYIVSVILKLKGNICDV